MPDHTQCMELLLVKERSIVSRDVSLSWKKKLMLGQNLSQCVQMMLINSLVWDVRVTGYGSRKLEIGVPPFLSNITPVSLRLEEREKKREERRSAKKQSKGSKLFCGNNKHTKPSARDLICGVIDEDGLAKARLHALSRASVTVVRQSTHVPKTSKKRAFG